MSSRFHQKYHRYNHHSVVPGSGNVTFPDEGYDPIASFDSPFRGEFFSNDPIISTELLSSSQHVAAGLDVIAKRDVYVGNDLTISYDLSVARNVVIGGDLTVDGTYTALNTVTYASSALEIQNTGTGPALKVSQSGIEPLAMFVDTSGPSSNLVIIANNSFIGVKTSEPNKELTVNGEISATNVVTVPHLVLTSPVSYPLSIITNTPVTLQLPLTANDIEITSTGSAMITSFADGVKGVHYVLTNVGAYTITLSSLPTNPKIYVRNGTAWKSNTYTLSAAYLQLPPYTSCSLRIGTNNKASVW